MSVRKPIKDLEGYRKPKLWELIILTAGAILVMFMLMQALHLPVVLTALATAGLVYVMVRKAQRGQL